MESNVPNTLLLLPCAPKYLGRFFFNCISPTVFAVLRIRSFAQHCECVIYLFSDILQIKIVVNAMLIRMLRNRSLRVSHSLTLFVESPVIVSFTLLCVAVRFLDSATFGSATRRLACLPGNFEVHRLVTYIAAHSSFSHLCNNFSTILLTGPAIEKQLSSKTTAWIILAVSLSTGIFNALFLSTGLIGSSGLAFAFVFIFPSVGNWQKGRVPLSYAMLAALWLGKEASLLLFGDASDGVSRFAHLFGGVAGAAFALSPKCRKIVLSLW